MARKLTDISRLVVLQQFFEVIKMSWLLFDKLLQAVSIAVSVKVLTPMRDGCLNVAEKC